MSSEFCDQAGFEDLPDTQNIIIDTNIPRLYRYGYEYSYNYSKWEKKM